MVSTPSLVPTGTGMESSSTPARVNTTFQSDNNKHNDSIRPNFSSAEKNNNNNNNNDLYDDFEDAFGDTSNDNQHWTVAHETDLDWEEDVLKDTPDPRADANFAQNALEVVAKDGIAKPNREVVGIKSNIRWNTDLCDDTGRPSKRSRHEDEDNGSVNTRALEIWTMVVEDNCNLYAADPPVDKKKRLARLFNMSYADVDAEFWKHRQGRHTMGPPPLPKIQINNDMVLDDEEQSSQPKSKSKNPDSFTTAESSSQYARSEADRTMTSISSIDSGIYHCTKPDCPKAYNTLSLWERHETDIHWNQFKWMCLLCAIVHTNGVFSCKHCEESLSSLKSCIEHVLYCVSARQSAPFLWKREIDLKNHLKSKDHSNEGHRLLSIQRIRLCKAWSFPWDSGWPRNCIFCFKSFTTWNERKDHYINQHFPPSKKPSRSHTPSQKQIGFQPNSQNTQPG
ncbi:hypothetical protein B0J14DRAFT_25291 [Halenospora varia]|nr:hypothetical protein B0J14DRAFT_25291 [Halenospora varia]